MTTKPIQQQNQILKGTEERASDLLAQMYNLRKTLKLKSEMQPQPISEMQELGFHLQEAITAHEEEMKLISQGCVIVQCSTCDRQEKVKWEQLKELFVCPACWLRAYESLENNSVVVGQSSVGSSNLLDVLRGFKQ